MNTIHHQMPRRDAKKMFKAHKLEYGCKKTDVLSQMSKCSLKISVCSAAFWAPVHLHEAPEQG